ncbi:FadR/GntR family transcriptional regulator [Parapedobacter indicus]|jgi:Transcriptional regulators|uniref:DNA-binding transcriptional regulator, FadR family n=1 Tax=Parapedobacter indicus TaxID=1477437 RepID=A0A1I3FXZ7_9SPHI|nr:FCD domain-containing protein [Parapedobacter indicus]SFI15791.1 DNA-binding transcriptional regulator, FadR family [Parapedobacter indicus]
MSLEKLRPVENLSQVDKIEMSLQEYLRSENFQPGDSLPKELELAQAMGVSRTAIREALSRFRTLGIIESRKNRGMVIAKPDVFNNMERVLDPQLLDDETMNEIFEMRLVIEVGLGDVLFLRKNDADLSKLERIVEKEEKTTKKIDIVKYDIEFHSMLYKLSGNKTIMRFQKMLLPIFDHVYANLSKDTEAYTGNIPEDMSPVSHRDLLNTLKNGNLEQFRSQMRTHLMVYFKKLSTD